MNSSPYLCLLLFFVAISPSHSCGPDEECKHITTCEENKFFIAKNLSKMKKMRVCEFLLVPTKYCCKKVEINTTAADSLLLSHENIHLINHSKCGRTNGNRIVGGSIATVGSMPWMALLLYKNTKIESTTRFLCGGSLISPKYVLTAAHCTVVVRFTLVSVRLGEHRISTDRDCLDETQRSTCNTDEPPIQDIDIEKIIAHEDYPQIKDTDIALLRLKSGVRLDGIKFIATICLPVSLSQSVDVIKSKEEENVKLIAAGWGISEDNFRQISDVLKYAELPYVSNEECSGEFRELQKDLPREHQIQLTQNFMCAGGHNKTDSCKGDSGGPLTCLTPNYNGIDKIFQQGIVSMGISCDSPTVAPGIYVRVFPYIKWILDHLEE